MMAMLSDQVRFVAAIFFLSLLQRRKPNIIICVLWASNHFSDQSVGYYHHSSYQELRNKSGDSSSSRWLESIPSSPVQALHVSNRTEFYSVLFLAHPLGLDKRLLLDYYQSPETVLNLHRRDHHDLSPQIYAYK
jgi:hypothetical protein